MSESERPKVGKVSKQALKVGAMVDHVLNTVVVAERNNEDPWEALGLAHLSDEEKERRLIALHDSTEHIMRKFDKINRAKQDG